LGRAIDSSPPWPWKNKNPQRNGAVATVCRFCKAVALSSSLSCLFGVEVFSRKEQQPGAELRATYPAALARKKEKNKNNNKSNKQGKGLRIL
jgi:hypothetical protein